jgi:hypothetical protein
MPPRILCPVPVGVGSRHREGKHPGDGKNEGSSCKDLAHGPSFICLPRTASVLLVQVGVNRGFSYASPLPFRPRGTLPNAGPRKVWPWSAWQTWGDSIGGPGSSRVRGTPVSSDPPSHRHRGGGVLLRSTARHSRQPCIGRPTLLRLQRHDPRVLRPAGRRRFREGRPDEEGERRPIERLSHSGVHSADTGLSRAAPAASLAHCRPTRRGTRMCRR